MHNKHKDQSEINTAVIVLSEESQYHSQQIKGSLNVQNAMFAKTYNMSVG